MSNELAEKIARDIQQRFIPGTTATQIAQTRATLAAMIAPHLPDAAPLDAELAEAQRLYEQLLGGEWGYDAHGHIQVVEDDGELGPTVATVDVRTKDARATAEWIVRAKRLWPRLVAREGAVWDAAINVLRGNLCTPYAQGDCKECDRRMGDIRKLEAARDAL